MLKFSAWLACVTAIVLAGWIAALKWTGLMPDFARDLYYFVLWPDFISASLIIAVLLFWGGVTTLRQRRLGPGILTGGWGFALGILFLSTTPLIRVASEAVGVSAIFKNYLIYQGLLSISAAIGLLTAVIGARRDS